MAKTVTIRITFIRTAVLAVSVVVALLASGSCDASCGEYVFSRFRPPTHQMPNVRRHVALNDRNILKSGLVRSSEVNVDSHEKFSVLPIPCSGPGCNRNPTPSLPVAPPITVAGGSQDRLICGQRAVELPSEMSRRWELKDVARALRGFPLLIEMPPESIG